MKAVEFVTEKWTKKYKSSINCSNPKGFSQKAHCAGKKTEDQEIDQLMTQLDEACWKGYRKDGMKTMFGKRYPNCVKKKKKSESIKETDQTKTESVEQELEIIKEDLRKWFKDKWVRFGPDGKIRGDCARGSSKEGKPKCLPKSKAQSLGKKGRAKAAARKRRQDPNADRKGKAINVKTK